MAIDYDVVVVGFGPTGAMLASCLGRAGWRVGVVERWNDIYPLPRAVHFDDEVGRIFGAAGLRDEVLAITDPVPDFYEWRNRHGQALLKIDWAAEGSQGWPTANFFTQPALQRLVADHAHSLSEVEVLTGWEVEAIEDRGDRVTVSASRQARPQTSLGDSPASRTAAHQERQPADQQRCISGRYVIGADGANSTVRESIQAHFRDLGFVPFDWLIVDLIPQDVERSWKPMNWQLCDPARPTTVVSGGPGRRRWEFMRLPGETIEELNTEAAAWRLLEPWDMTPENAVLERHAVYRFMACYADRWRSGRVLIAGDAAHLMPPFAGQGMCNGLRDAMNLTWKLDLILRGVAPESLLDSYQAERLDHVRQWIDFSAALGEVICVLDEAQALERDERMIAGGADPIRVLPAAPPQRLGTGLFQHDQATAGIHFIQGSVRGSDTDGLFDDVIGTGFCLLGRNSDPLASLDLEQRAFLAEIGTHAVWLVDSPNADPHRDEPREHPTDPAARPIIDLDGVYNDWFAAHQCEYVLIRPDFYVFGTARSADDLRMLIDTLIGVLRASSATDSAPSDDLTSNGSPVENARNPEHEPDRTGTVLRES